MTGEDPDIFDELFGDTLRPGVLEQTPQPAPPSVQIVAGEASAKLSRNLDLALERQGEILAKPITDETDPRERRLVAEVSHQVVKTAVGVDANKLQARNDNVMARILYTLAQEKERLNLPLNRNERMRLDAGPPSKSDGQA